MLKSWRKSGSLQMEVFLFFFLWKWEWTGRGCLQEMIIWEMLSSPECDRGRTELNPRMLYDRKVREECGMASRHWGRRIWYCCSWCLCRSYLRTPSPEVNKLVPGDIDTGKMFSLQLRRRNSLKLGHFYNKGIGERKVLIRADGEILLCFKCLLKWTQEHKVYLIR